MTASDNDAKRPPFLIVLLARSGYAARSIVFLMIGTLAFLQAVGRHGDEPDSRGAIAGILQAPGGNLILWVLAGGLLGFSLWRLCQSLLDADNHGRSLRALGVRAGLLISATTYLLLAVYSASLAFSIGASEDGSDSRESLVGMVLGWPGGQIIVSLVACCIAAVGIAHWWKGYHEHYREHFAIDESLMARLNPICKFGLYARGLAFVIISGMFLTAAIQQDADEAGGLAQVLEQASQQLFGSVLVGIMAAGLFSFGIYCAIEAIFRTINAPLD